MKKILSVFLVLAVLCAFSAAAFADHLTGGSDWRVTFTAEEKMESTFKASGYADEISNLQPGDDLTLTVTLKNENEKDTDWYMTNEVLQSLEDNSAAAGGAYAYTLTYTGPDGTTRDLYSSDTVGGDDSNGLSDATSALADYFYLDALASGESAVITLNVALDGETQGNAYIDTQAALQMNFAVEIDEPAPASGTTNAASPTPTPAPGSNVDKVVKTGDEMELFPFYVAMAVSGVLFLALAIDSVRRRRKENDA